MAASDRTDRQLYLYVEHGTLDLLALNPAALRLFLSKPTADIQGVATFEGEAAKVADGSQMRDVDGGTLRLEGHIVATMNGPTHGRIPITATGSVRAAMDGRALTWAAPVAGSSGAFSWWPILLVGFVATPTLAAGGFYGTRWRETSRMDRLEDLMVVGDWEAVAARAPRLARSRHFGLDASVMHVDALVRLGRLDEALRVASRLKAPHAGGAPVLDFVLAYLYAARGDKKQALKHAIACVKAGPEFQEHLRTYPEFASIHADLRSQGLLPAEKTPPLPAGYA
jgi:hypothetical protein